MQAEREPESRKVVALGGGHGLHASLSALRLITDSITAVVTVADDGGSSGRIRRELGVLPPGDLRMALAALAGQTSEDAQWVRLLQHRFGGEGALAGHPVGNLILTALLEEHVDPVVALDIVSAQIGAVGRVLPMSPVPLDLLAEVDRLDPEDPTRRRYIRGQSSIAATPGRVRTVRIIPTDAPSCSAAIEAIQNADAVVLGPGSWFTSVIPHLLLSELGDAIASTSAQVVVTLNLVPQAGETEDFSTEELLDALSSHAPRLRIDAVVADENALSDPDSLQRYASKISARLVVSQLAADGAVDRHDPRRLSVAFEKAFGWDSARAV